MEDEEAEGKHGDEEEKEEEDEDEEKETAAKLTNHGLFQCWVVSGRVIE